jgi:hypothetical protein
MNGQQSTTQAAALPSRSTNPAARKSFNPNNFGRSIKPKRAQAKPARERGVPYQPGFADHLLAVKEHAPAKDLTGIGFEVGASGALIAVEHTRSGNHPRHMVRDYPYSLEMVLPNGERILIEAISLGREDYRPSLEERVAALVGYRTPEELAAIERAEELEREHYPALLWLFGEYE